MHPCSVPPFKHVVKQLALGVVVATTGAAVVTNGAAVVTTMGGAAVVTTPPAEHAPVLHLSKVVFLLFSKLFSLYSDTPPARPSQTWGRGKASKGSF